MEKRNGWRKQIFSSNIHFGWEILVPRASPFHRALLTIRVFIFFNNDQRAPEVVDSKRVTRSIAGGRNLWSRVKFSRTRRSRDGNKTQTRSCLSRSRRLTDFLSHPLESLTGYLGKASKAKEKGRREKQIYPLSLSFTTGLPTSSISPVFP